MINARADTIASKPAFRSAFKTRRCIVPATGYYEWKKLPDGTKQPYYFTREDSLAFAAMWLIGELNLSLKITETLLHLVYF